MHGSTALAFWREETERIRSIPDETLNLDTIEDQIREHVARGLDIAPIITEQLREEAMQLRHDGFRLAIEEIIRASNPKLLAYQLAFAVGMDLLLGLSGPEIAKRLHVTKQHFHNGVEAIRQRMQLAHVAGRRSQEARDNMRARNYRRKR